MTSPTRARAQCRLSDYRAFQCRACGTTASTRCGGLTAIGRARAWLAATLVRERLAESSLCYMAAEDGLQVETFHYHYLNLHPQP